MVQSGGVIAGEARCVEIVVNLGPWGEGE